jgi:hypothetical protein
VRAQANEGAGPIVTPVGLALTIFVFGYSAAAFLVSITALPARRTARTRTDPHASPIVCS